MLSAEKPRLMAGLFGFSLSKNYSNALVSCIIMETGVFL